MDPPNNSVGSHQKIQSETRGKNQLPTEFLDDGLDEWRFEIKRKKREATRKNSGSTAKASWYFWVIRVNRSSGQAVYYGTLDELDNADPARLEKYWKRSKSGVKRGRT